MSDIALTYAETPLAWPASISIDDLKICKSCGIRVYSPQAGSLQILTRRQGAGVGDGVNIEEHSAGVGAEYRGQTYALEETIFQTPGLHVFPGRKEVYPAEYHIHMRSTSVPIRYITIVIPVSHIAADIATDGSAYFAAAAAKPDPSAERPTLASLLGNNSSTIKVAQYQGPDIRGRTALTEVTADSSVKERQFLMVLNVVGIRATDLERIPREGSLSTDVRDLPAPPVLSKSTVSRDRFLRVVVLANPGIATSTSSTDKPDTDSQKEMECKPIKVVNGRDVVDISGQAVDIMTLLGISGETLPNEASMDFAFSAYSNHATMFVGTLLGLLFADWLVVKIVWDQFFRASARYSEWEPFKIWMFVFISLVAAGFTGGILGLVGL